MASRRDQLNAYTFARKRMVAAFLQPSATGSEEAAPRPLRAVVPSLVVGALALAGFGAWGLIKPTAPQGWDTPRANVLVGSESTTRYIVWSNSDKQKPELHPVLNLASAKLLLDPDKFSVLKVDESVLDNGKLQQGPTVGIPYAPDRMPSPADAATAKQWAVCEQPRGGGDPATSEPQKAAFVFGRSDRSAVAGTGRLGPGKVLFVESPERDRYLVDSAGTAHKLVSNDQSTGNGRDLLSFALFQGSPQMVTDDWLDTLNKGTDISIPDIAGFGQPAGVPALGDANRVGMVVEVLSGTRKVDYVVLRNGAAQITPFVARLLMYAKSAIGMYGTGNPAPRGVNVQALPTLKPFATGADWPTGVTDQVNTGADTTSCSVYSGTMDPSGDKPDMTMWAGPSYPKKTLDNGGTSAYVTPGSGLLFRQLTGGTSGGGGIYLVTDTGLRYSVPKDATANTDDTKKTKDAQTLLGYGQIKPVDVPRAWAAFLPTGPVLSPQAAAQEQES